MRHRLAWCVSATAAGLLLTGSLVAQDNYQFSDPNVQDLFRYARMSVGGAVSKLKALEFKGRSKVEMNGALIDCTVDIKILLPDHYLRVDTTPTDAKLAGYAGKTVLSAIRSGANLSTPPDNLTSAILKNERTRLARFLLGTLTYVTPDVAMVFHSAGLNVDMVDASDKWPTKLLYAGGLQEETMTFADRRDVGGLKIPFRVTTTAGGRVIDELVFDQVLVNPEIGKGDFKR
jgi:hypothetical protein